MNNFIMGLKLFLKMSHPAFYSRCDRGSTLVLLFTYFTMSLLLKSIFYKKIQKKFCLHQIFMYFLIKNGLYTKQVSGTMMHKIKCTDCTTLRKCNIIHQTGLKVVNLIIACIIFYITVYYCVFNKLLQLITFHHAKYDEHIKFWKLQNISNLKKKSLFFMSFLPIGKLLYFFVKFNINKP